jgi:hypothetical protein
MAEFYVYQPLSGPQCIRVLELAPANEKTDRLEGTLVEVNLALAPKQRPNYEALSYVWASPEDQGAIFCKGPAIPVTKNCEAALRQLRHRKRIRRLWIDAICINQNDINERNQQVNIMDQVYRDAQYVRIWLGLPEKESFGLWLLNINIQCTRWVLKPFWDLFWGFFRPMAKIATAFVCFPALGKCFLLPARPLVNTHHSRGTNVINELSSF